MVMYIECPNCKEEAFLDYYYKTGEEYMICDHCGYTYTKILKNRDKLLYELVQDDWEKTILDNPYGCAKIKYIDTALYKVIPLKSIDDFLKLKSEVLKIDGIEKLILSRFVNGKIKVENIIE